jgi:hypothetical protein
VFSASPPPPRSSLHTLLSAKHTFAIVVEELSSLAVAAIAFALILIVP